MPCIHLLSYASVSASSKGPGQASCTQTGPSAVGLSV